jgi:hypothetical protein
MNADKCELNQSSQMFSCKIPWNGIREAAVVVQAMRQNYPGSRSHCSDCPGVHMTDEAWHLLESCWTIDASRRPNLPHVRDIIILLKISHDMNAMSGDSDRQSPSFGSSSLGSTSKIEAVLTTSRCPPSLFELSPYLQPAPGRTPFVRYRRKDCVDPIAERPTPSSPPPSHTALVRLIYCSLDLAYPDGITSSRK